MRLPQLNWRKPTFWLILGFIALATWGAVRDANAELAGRVGVGFGFANVQESGIQEVQLLIDNDYYLQVARIGGGVLPDTWRYSAGFRFDWREGYRVEPYLRLGVAYWDQEPSRVISDRTNFDLALGLRFGGALELEVQHNSTAGRSQRNSGVDFFTLGIVKRF